MINVLKNIKKHVPDFITNFDEDENYPVVFEFGLYLIKHGNNSDLYKKAASFVNEIMELKLEEEEELIVMELFQQFYEADDQIGFLFTSELSERAKGIYDSAYKEYIRNFPPKKRRR